MNPRVILLHGFNVFDGGAGTVGKLTPFFEKAGFRVKPMRYGWRGLGGVWFLNATFSGILADLAEPGDIVVGHSNGCAIAAGAFAKGAEFSQLVFINPALDADHVFPASPSLRAVHVWHSPSDKPVALAKWIPGHAWGDMGAVGYRGPTDARVTSYNKENGYRVSSSKHSDIFEPAKLDFFAPLIVSKVTSLVPAQLT